MGSLPFCTSPWSALRFGSSSRKAGICAVKESKKGFQTKEPAAGHCTVVSHELRLWVSKRSSSTPAVVALRDLLERWKSKTSCLFHFIFPSPVTATSPHSPYLLPSLNSLLSSFLFSFSLFLQNSPIQTHLSPVYHSEWNVCDRNETGLLFKNKMGVSPSSPWQVFASSPLLSYVTVWRFRPPALWSRKYGCLHCTEPYAMVFGYWLMSQGANNNCT